MPSGLWTYLKFVRDCVKKLRSTFNTKNNYAKQKLDRLVKNLTITFKIAIGES